jgi:hypothetical protein
MQRQLTLAKASKTQPLARKEKEKEVM